MLECSPHISTNTYYFEKNFLKKFILYVIHDVRVNKMEYKNVVYYIFSKFPNKKSVKSHKFCVFCE